MKINAQMALRVTSRNLEIADRLRALGADVVLIQVSRRIETLEVEAEVQDAHDAEEVTQILNELRSSLFEPGFLTLAEANGQDVQHGFFGTPEADALNEQLAHRLQMAARGLRLTGKPALSTGLSLH